MNPRRRPPAAPAGAARSAAVAVGPPRSPAERRALLDILGSVFGFAEGRAAPWARSVGHGNLRVVRSAAGELAGGLALLPMGQWFGGRSVPCTGVAAVGIAPEQRASGLASTLMAATVREIAAAGTALSALYPATQPVYRRVGYEQAGTMVRHRAEPSDMDASERRDGVRRATATDLPAMDRLYAEWARCRDGHLDRNAHLRRRAFGLLSPEQERVVVTRDGKVVGYAALAREEAEGPVHEIRLVDFAFADGTAGRRLLSYLAAHRSMVRRVSWTGGAADEFAALLREPDVAVERLYRWMLRVTCVPAALEARGYPAGLRADVPLEIDDPLVEGNRGRWRLRVADGRGRAERGGDGAVRLDVNALAALYSGFRAPAAARAAGLAVEGPADALAALGACFAGPAPSMREMF